MEADRIVGWRQRVGYESPRTHQARERRDKRPNYEAEADIERRSHATAASQIIVLCLLPQFANFDRLIDVVWMPDGGLTTLDNTRILAASRAGVNIWARVWKHTDPLPNDTDFISRFVGRRREIPQTFGDAVLNRISNQNSRFRNTYPYGSPFIGSSR